MKLWDPADRSTENMGSHMLSSAFTGIGICLAININT